MERNKVMNEDVLPQLIPVNLQQAICTMMSFYYYDLNALGFGFLVQIKAFVI